jgi:hypothetical protein
MPACLASGLIEMKYVARDAARLSLHHRSWTGICRVTHLFVISEGDGRPFAREVATDNGKKSVMEVSAKQRRAWKPLEKWPP